MDPIEGIWSADRNIKFYNQSNQLTNNIYSPQFAKYAIIRNGDKFKTCCISKGGDPGTVIFTKTTLLGVYLCQRNMTEDEVVSQSQCNNIERWIT
ncbi:MAG: hypothetical protein IPK08_17200 [Bacteroidetes bacterium]|nr:hypothetical protein [Bacteroidota bacterium]